MRRTEVLQGIRLMKFEEILERTRSRELSQEEEASVLGVSERTFRRWRDRDPLPRARVRARPGEGLFEDLLLHRDGGLVEQNVLHPIEAEFEQRLVVGLERLDRFGVDDVGLEEPGLENKRRNASTSVETIKNIRLVCSLGALPPGPPVVVPSRERT